MKKTKPISRDNHFYFTWAFCLLFFFGTQMQAAQKKVLFYGPTFQTGGVAASLIANNPTEFYAIGSGSDVWTPGGTPASKDWSKKTAAGFQAFDAIVIGDLNDSNGDVSVWAGAIANRDIWSSSSVITGNVVIFGGDPEQHAVTGGNAAGAQALIEQCIRFAAANGRGLFVSLSDVNVNAPSPVHPLIGAGQDLLGALGSFSLVSLGSGANSVRKLYSHPTTDCVSEEALSDWIDSCHSGFLSYPSGYLPLAMATDIAAQFRTPSPYIPAGELGLVHLIAKGRHSRLEADESGSPPIPPQTDRHLARRESSAGW